MRIYKKVQVLNLLNSHIGTYHMISTFTGKKYTQEWFNQHVAGLLKEPAKFYSFDLFLSYREVLSLHWGIYCIYSITEDSFYIGSSIDLKERLTNHYNGGDSNSNLQAAIQRHTLADFILIIVLDFGTELSGLPNKWLRDVEDIYLDAYPKNKMYNTGRCAQGGVVQHTEASKLKMAAAAKLRVGAKRTDETKKRISLALKGKQNALGNKHTEETKLKQSEAAKIKQLGSFNHRATPVIIINQVTGEQIAFDTVKAAANHIGRDPTTLTEHLLRPLDKRGLCKKVWRIYTPAELGVHKSI